MAAPVHASPGGSPGLAHWPEAKLRNLALLEQDLAEERCLSRALPPVISLYTTQVCNLRCIMCERSVVRGTRKLDRPTLQRVADELFPTAFKVYVAGSNGEPLLSDFDVVVDGALRHGAKIDIVTNGTHLTLERYRAVREALVLVNVSLDAHVPEVYERIRAGSSFARVLANLRAIAEERRRSPDGVVFDVSALLMRSNAAILPDFIRFAAELGVDHVHIQVLRHFMRPLPEEELSPQVARRVRLDRAGGRAAIHTDSGELPSELAEPLAAIAEAARTAGVNVNFGDFLLPDVACRPVPTKLDGLRVPGSLCWNVALNFGVQYNGDVYPCCHPTDYVLGNVVTTSPREVWNSPAAQRLRAAHFARRRIPFCTGCTQAPYLGPGRSGVLASTLDRARLLIQHGKGVLTGRARRA